MPILKKKTPATSPAAVGRTAPPRPAPAKAVPKRKETVHEPKKEEKGPEQRRAGKEAEKPVIPTEQPADTRQSRPTTQRAATAKTFVLEEEVQVRHRKTGHIWTLRKEKYRKGMWYFAREDEVGRWRTASASEEEITEAVKAECHLL